MQQFGLNYMSILSTVRMMNILYVIRDNFLHVMNWLSDNVGAAKEQPGRGSAPQEQSDWEKPISHQKKRTAAV